MNDLSDNLNFSRRAFLKYAALISLVSIGVFSSLGLVDKPLFDPKYGEIIKVFRPNASNHLYIIGDKHPAPKLGKNIQERFNGVSKEINLTEGVFKTQIEIFRIIGDLIKNKKVGLILSEGTYLEDEDPLEEILIYVKENLDQKTAKFLRETNDKDLEGFLTRFEILNTYDFLSGYVYGINVQGAESKEMHETHINLTKFSITNRNKVNSQKLDSLEDYVSKTRSALILRNSLKVIERELNKGKIKNKQAIIPIGYLHLDEMIEFIDSDFVKILPPEGFEDLPQFKESLGLKDYGVTIIKPRSLLK